MNIQTIIEIPKGCRLKYEIDNSNNVVLDRVLPRGLSFPANYGFIPNTLAGDNDALDVLLLTDYPLCVKCRVKCRPIGVLIMTDEKGLDEKILAVPSHEVDSSYDSVVNINNISERVLAEIKMFFEMYKTIDDNKWTRVEGFYDVKQAEQLIQKYTI